MYSASTATIPTTATTPTTPSLAPTISLAFSARGPGSRVQPPVRLALSTAPQHCAPPLPSPQHTHRAQHRTYWTTLA